MVVEILRPVGVERFVTGVQYADPVVVGDRATVWSDGSDATYAEAHTREQGPLTTTSSPMTLFTKPSRPIIELNAMRLHARWRQSGTTTTRQVAIEWRERPTNRQIRRYTTPNMAAMNTTYDWSYNFAPEPWWTANDPQYYVPYYIEHLNAGTLSVNFFTIAWNPVGSQATTRIYELWLEIDAVLEAPAIEYVDDGIRRIFVPPKRY